MNPSSAIALVSAALGLSFSVFSALEMASSFLPQAASMATRTNTTNTVHRAAFLVITFLLDSFRDPNRFGSAAWVRYFMPRVLSMKATMCSAHHLKASSADPHLENRSPKDADLSSTAARIGSLVVESRASSSALVAPEPDQEPVAPFLTRLNAKPMGRIELTALTPGLLALTPVIAMRTRATSGPGSATIGYLSLKAATIA